MEQFNSLGIGNTCIPMPTSTHDKNDHNPVLEEFDYISKCTQIQKLNGNLDNNTFKQLLAMQMELWKFWMICEYLCGSLWIVFFG